MWNGDEEPLQAMFEPVQASLVQQGRPAEPQEMHWSEEVVLQIVLAAVQLFPGWQQPAPTALPQVVQMLERLQLLGGEQVVFAGVACAEMQQVCEFAPHAWHLKVVRLQERGWDTVPAVQLLPGQQSSPAEPQDWHTWSELQTSGEEQL